MTSDSIQIRAAALADLEALIDSRVAMFRELGSGPAASALAEFRAACRVAMSDVLGSGAGAAWLAIGGDGAVHGAVFLLEFPRLPSPNNVRCREGYVLNVYVVPQARRRGVAAALMDAALTECRRRGLARVRLHATPDGARVYERLGFKRRDDEMELVL